MPSSALSAELETPDYCLAQQASGHEIDKGSLSRTSPHEDRRTVIRYCTVLTEYVKGRESRLPKSISTMTKLATSRARLRLDSLQPVKLRASCVSCSNHERDAL